MPENHKIILLKKQSKPCFHFCSRTNSKHWKFSTNVKGEGGMSTQGVEDSSVLISSSHLLEF